MGRRFIRSGFRYRWWPGPHGRGCGFVACNILHGIGRYWRGDHGRLPGGKLLLPVGGTATRKLHAQDHRQQQQEGDRGCCRNCRSPRSPPRCRCRRCLINCLGLTLLQRIEFSPDGAGVGNARRMLCFCGQLLRPAFDRLAESLPFLIV